jgi:hypothetical protein
MLFYRKQEKRNPSRWEAVLELGGLFGGYYYGDHLGGMLPAILFSFLGLFIGKVLNHLLARTRLPQAWARFHQKAAAAITRWDTGRPTKHTRVWMPIRRQGRLRLSVSSDAPSRYRIP